MTNTTKNTDFITLVIRNATIQASSNNKQQQNLGRGGYTDSGVVPLGY